MVECARLESVYTLTRIEGSNPSLSAILNNELLINIESMNYSSAKLRTQAHRNNLWY